MSDPSAFKWFAPSEHGDQAPDVWLTNRKMNRIDLALMLAVILAIVWNLLGVRGIRSSDGGMPSLAAADDFFLRPSTIVLWSVVIVAIVWLVARYIVTRETRFTLIWQGLLLAFAALVPMLSTEMAGLDVLSPGSEMQLTVYECEGAPVHAEPNLSRCGGFAMESGSIQMVGANPATTDAATRVPNEITANTARWGGLPAGEYTIYLRVETPNAVCTNDRPPVVAIDADPEINCLDSGSTLVRLTHPDDTRNLRLAIYPDAAE